MYFIWSNKKKVLDFNNPGAVTGVCLSAFECTSSSQSFKAWSQMQVTVFVVVKQIL